MGGNSNSVRAELAGGVDQMAGTSSACTAVKQCGSVVTGGAEFSGGNSDDVSTQLTSVAHVVGNCSAFAAARTVLRDPAISFLCGNALLLATACSVGLT